MIRTERAQRVNHPAHEKAAIGLWLAMQACQEYLDAHWNKVDRQHEYGDCCDKRHCEQCRMNDLFRELDGIRYTVEMFASLIDGNLIHPEGPMSVLWNAMFSRKIEPDTGDFIRALAAVWEVEQKAEPEPEAEAEPDYVTEARRVLLANAAS